jgi:uncharacterized delta-60 repeat protein
MAVTLEGDMAAGDLDPDFGTNGIVTTDFDTDFRFNTDIFRILVEPDGSIVAAGTASSQLGFSNGALARYRPNGDLDPTFGRPVVPSARPGTLLFNFVGGLDSLPDNSDVFGLARQNDGKLIVVGGSYIAGGEAGVGFFSVARLNMPDGSRDLDFGEVGSPLIDLGSTQSSARDVVIRDDDVGCVVAGSVQIQGTGSNFALAGFTQAPGGVDLAFGELGKVVTDLGSSGDAATAIVAQPDQKIVVGGHFGNRMPDGNFALARYDADGVLDPAFGVNGIVITDFGLEDTVRGLAVQPGDGKIVAVGTDFNPSGRNQFRAALARYNPDGSLDATFGNGGQVLECLGPANDCGGANCVALQEDGKIVVGGASVLARFNADAILDPTFGAAGKVTLPAEVGVQSVAIQGDGKILAGGSMTSPSGHRDFALLRYLA